VLNGIGIVSSRDQTLINACIAVWNFLFAVGASIFVDKFGRRKLLLTSNVGMLVGFAILTACAAVYQNTGKERAGHAVLAMVFVYQGAYAIAYTPLLVSYSVEILPFFLRAKGLAMLYTTVTAALIFSQYVNPIALEALRWKYYLIYTIWLVFELAFVYFFAVETRGRSLEETAALFDRDAALPEMEDRPKESVITDHVSSQSSKASLTPAQSPSDTTAKPRVCDGREGFQLYDLRGKPGSRSFASR
ncbi:hypothetical protein FRC08_011787, partial [Ceratobasidium sp. 394]